MQLDPNDPMAQQVMAAAAQDRQIQAARQGVINQIAVGVFVQLAMLRKADDDELGPVTHADGLRLANNATALAEEYGPFFLEHVGLIPPKQDDDVNAGQSSSTIVTTGD